MGWKLPSSRVPGDMRDLGLSRLAIPCVAGPVLTSVCSLSPSVGPAPVPGGLPTSADHPRSQEPTFSREASEEEQLVGWEGGSKPLRIDLTTSTDEDIFPWQQASITSNKTFGLWHCVVFIVLLF